MPPSRRDSKPASPSPASGRYSRLPALSRRQVIIGAIAMLLTIVGLYFLIPKLIGLDETWGQLQQGDPLLLIVAGLLEMCSLAGYMVLFHTVFGRGMLRINWRATMETTLAGIAAIRLFAAAGAGGIAVVAWALGRAGMPPSVIARRMVANYVTQYSIYLSALVVCGFGLWTGAFPGGGAFGLTVLPALLAIVVIAFFLTMALVPEDFERRLARLAGREDRVGRWASRLAAAPALLGSGVRSALRLVRRHPSGLLGAAAYWGFDIAVLGVSFKAFDQGLPLAVLVMGYFLGTLGSLLPLPGGIGGIDGGMIGAFVAFGVPGGRAVAGVLAYRAISFWLPTIPGVAGYFSLRSTVRGWREVDERAHA